MDINILDMMLILDCSPILFQYVNYLKQCKFFTRNEISNYLIPAFFYANVFVIPIGYTSLITMNTYVLRLFIVSLPLVIMSLIFFAPKYRPNADSTKTNIISLLMVMFAYVCGSCSECFRSIIRSVDSKCGSEGTLYKLKSESIRSLFTWLGQDLYSETGSFNEIYLLSYLVYMSVIIYTSIGDYEANTKKAITLQQFFLKIKRGLANTTVKQRCNMCIHILNSSLKLFLGLFNVVVLMEIQRREKLQKDLSKVGNKEETATKFDKFKKFLEKINFFLYKIINLITKTILFLFRKESSTVKRDVVGTGYILSIVKVLSTLVAFGVGKAFEKTPLSPYYCLFISYPLCLFLFMAFSNCTSIVSGSILFLATSCILQIMECFIQNTHRTNLDRHVVSSFVLLSVGLINSAINIFSMLFKIDIRKKCIGFLTACLICYFIVSILSIIYV